MVISREVACCSIVNAYEASRLCDDAVVLVRPGFSTRRPASPYHLRHRLSITARLPARRRSSPAAVAVIQYEVPTCVGTKLGPSKKPPSHFPPGRGLPSLHTSGVADASVTCSSRRASATPFANFG